jgi:hypothetical protein
MIESMRIRLPEECKRVTMRRSLDRWSVFDWKFGWVGSSPPDRSLAAQIFVWRDAVRKLNLSGRLGSRLRKDVPIMGPGSICASFACQCSVNHAIRSRQRARCNHHNKWLAICWLRCCRMVGTLGIRPLASNRGLPMQSGSFEGLIESYPRELLKGTPFMSLRNTHVTIRSEKN